MGSKGDSSNLSARSLDDGSVLDAQGIKARFADFKSADIADVYAGYTRIPDVALISTDPVSIDQLKAVGELKAPRVPAHRFEHYRTAELKAFLFAQVIKYMFELRVMYGFMSTYESTVFLRQVFRDGEWIVEYSPNVKASFDGSGTGNEPSSVRQCFAYLSSLASEQAFVDNRTPRADWFRYA
ncbi:hypothetical protein N7535_002665 [Penicillium sp. DV-2018c]|nr:hypothetical protein N7461_001650 [Penicillium sp. DV-2018c]KAJ5575739.1 hypothetical protein N7535_002665 [Penicillium sp. DV-2018c]